MPIPAGSRCTSDSEADLRLAPNGFGRELRQALAPRQAFLIESGFAERRDHNVVYTKALLAALRGREREATAAQIHAETGLIPRPVEEGQPFGGAYRASTQLIRDRFAMLDDGIGFTLVPWRPAIEKQLSRELMIRVRGGSTAGLELGRLDHDVRGLTFCTPGDSLIVASLDTTQRVPADSRPFCYGAVFLIDSSASND